MPFLHIRTDQPLTEEMTERLHAAAARRLAGDLGKPCAHCMVQVEGGASLRMGDGTPGCAFIEATVKGAVGSKAAATFGKGLAAEVAAILDIPPGHVYTRLLQIGSGGLACALI